jgi:predicted metal-dependent phosphoesterase TrpH
VQRIDLHVHTRLSKNFEFNKRVVGQLAELGQRRGLTGFALTEHIHALDFWGMHDALQQKYRYGDGWYRMDNGLKMFSGCEVTVGERVDFIVVGELDEIKRLDESFSPRLSESHFPPAAEFLKRARELDTVVISAHPFRPGKETAKLPLGETFSMVDAVEVNGRDYVEGNELRVAALASAYGLPVSGGSDAHYYLQVGIRSTVVPAEELTIESIRQAFRERKTRAHCKRYARSVVEFCQEIKRVVKLRSEQEAAAVA